MAHYATFNDARNHLKHMLDAARLREQLAVLPGLRVEAVSEAGGWSMFVPGIPVAADGATFDEAADEMVLALREYAEDWAERLRLAPNHAGNWALVQLVGLSDDAELRAWVAGE